jgi:DNA-directed RNA polymerase specialized sigma24 family protein
MVLGGVRFLAGPRMNSNEPISSRVSSKARPRAATRSSLDRARPSPTVPLVSTDDTNPPAPLTPAERTKLLAAHPWKVTTKQLTAIAFKRIRGRSMKDAEDLAQSAIVDACERPENGGWDPAKGPLMGFLVGRVIGAALNERRRKRNVVEVWIDEEIEDSEDAGVRRHEKFLTKDEPPADEVLDRLRFSHTIAERVLARLAGDEFAIELVGHMMKGVASIDDLAQLTRRDESDVWLAKRRIRYHLDEITKELSAAAPTPQPGSARGAGEVTQ